MRRACLSILSLVLLIAVPSFASVIAPPANLGDLSRVSRTVVFAEAEGSRTELLGETPYTVTTFRVLQQVAGEAVGRSFEVREAGGVYEDVGMAVTGGVVFEQGGRYLLFLDPGTAGGWQTKMLSYGVLREDGGVLRPLPQAAELQLVKRAGVEPVGTYDKDGLIQHLSAVAAGSPWQPAGVTLDKKAARPAEQTENAQDTLSSASGSSSVAIVGAEYTSPPVCRYIRNETGDNVPLRWFGFETGLSVPIWHTTPGQVGIADGGVSAVQEAAAAWTNHTASAINVTYAGSRPTTVNCSTSPDGRARNNEVVFNDPCNKIPDLATCAGANPPGWTSPCCGQVAISGTFFNPNAPKQIHDGVAWWPAENLSIIVNNGAQCLGQTDFKEMVTHFVGHGLAFNHHEDNNATMAGQLGVHPSRGAAIAQTDRVCAAAVYHTFLDVPFDHWSWKYVEALQDAGITNGCGGGNFCRASFLTRAEMAVMLVRAMHGPTFVPPPATGVFADVPTTYWAAGHIEQLYRDGLTNGCSTTSLRYCPEGRLTRSEMVTFLMRQEHGASFTPPPATGIFSDVPSNHWAINNIEQAYNDGTTSGCGTNPLRFCPDQDLPRDEMAAFVTKAFNLPMPTEQ